MRNLISEFIFGRNAKVSAFFVVGIFLFVGLACSGTGKSDGDSKPTPPAYFGEWKGQDGSTVSIRADGKGDYISGGTKVEGGTVEINEAEKTLSITFFGIGPTLKIDKSPTSDEMKLDGVVYRRSGGFSTLTTDSGTTTPQKSTSANDSDGNLPSDSEVESLVKKTLEDFADGVEQEDFTNFHQNSSKDFQVSLTPSQIKTSFGSFITQKDKVLPILNSVGESSVKFSSPPRIRTEKGYKILIADGEFPTSPNTTKFETEYELEKGDWKILKFKIRL